MIAQTIRQLTSGENGKFKCHNFVEPLFKYCANNIYNGNIEMIYGLRSTGKTVDMIQVAEMLAEQENKVAYARFNYDEAGIDITNVEIKSSFFFGYTRFFIDEATYIGGFLNMSTEWSDVLVPANKKNNCSGNRQLL